MSESFVQVTEGSGKKLHSKQRVIGANTVEDEVVIVGEPYLATYTARANGVSTATANSHLLQIMAGASNRVYIRRIWLSQVALATTAATARLQIVRLTSAGTGGVGAPSTATKLDPADGAAGAAAQTLPTTKGAEGDIPIVGKIGLTATEPTTNIHEWEWEPPPGSPALIIAAGTANGIAVKNLDAVAGATVAIQVEYAEANF